jgi:hypothetical protein
MTHTTPLGEDRRPDAPQREIGVPQGIIGPRSHADRFFRPFGGGGHLHRRLISFSPMTKKLAFTLWRASTPGVISSFGPLSKVRVTRPILFLSRPGLAQELEVADRGRSYG